MALSSNMSALFQVQERAQFERRFIVLSFTLLTVRDISFTSQPPSAAIQLIDYCHMILHLGSTKVIF